MKLRSIMVSLVLGGIISSQLLAKDEPFVLAPSSPWVADYKEDGCRLLRKFGAGDNEMTLVMARYGVTDGFQLTIGGKPVKPYFRYEDARVQFGPVEQAQELTFLEGYIGESPAMLFGGSVGFAGWSFTDGKEPYPKNWTPRPELAPERIAAITTLVLDRKGRKPITLKIGSMAKPYAAWQTCVEDLVSSWGVDVEKHRKLRAPASPLNSPGDWVKSRDYPTKMLSARQPAIVQFRVMIDDKGAPNSCHIQETTRPKEFDDAVCGSIMKRAKFSPALDETGKPIASYYRNTVKFMIGG